MKDYTLYFEILGKKLRLTLPANSPEEAEQSLRDKLTINKIVEVEDTLKVKDPETAAVIQNVMEHFDANGKARPRVLQDKHVAFLRFLSKQTNCTVVLDRLDADEIVDTIDHLKAVELIEDKGMELVLTALGKDLLKASSNLKLTPDDEPFKYQFKLEPQHIAMLKDLRDRSFESVDYYQGNPTKALDDLQDLVSAGYVNIESAPGSEACLTPKALEALETKK